MNWLNKLKRKFGGFAIEGLMTYIVALKGITYLLSIYDQTGMFKYNLMLIPSKVANGEIWRLFTFIIMPPETSFIFTAFVLYFYYMIGTTLEHEWGSFKFNAYYFLGILGTILAAFLTGSWVTSFYINLSLFLAFAQLYPDYEIHLFLLIPIKVKYLALFNWLFIGYKILLGSFSAKVAAIVSLINFFIFFGRDIVNSIRNKKRTRERRKRFNAKKSNRKYIHKCTVCGITEKDDPEMGFRYCSKCDGHYEYCMEHLKDHQHIKNEDQD